ncbi:MAG: TauD/TfdA family dioxygenase [Gammaproteobacteria bacterium]|nr:TauD/TfdA family dioxygenase [Gammaproteobacteria bacterium]
MYKHFGLQRLTPTIGALVSGIDLCAPLSDKAFAELHAAWMEHLVLFFREQALTPDQHIALGQRFGELEVHPDAPCAHGIPELMVIHTDKDSRRNNGENWHSDVSSREEPPMASILHLTHVPEEGGDTLFANMYAAYDALSEPMQGLLDQLTAHHDHHQSLGSWRLQYDVPSADHPVVRVHPVTGKKALFVNAVFTEKIRGMSWPESDALLQFLFEHIKHPEFHCRFSWQANSVALWDNRCAQHLAVWDYYPNSRSGHRVTVKGDRPLPTTP